MLKIYAVKQKEKLDEAKYNKILFYLPGGVKTRIKRFIRWEDGQRLLLSSALIISKVCEHLNLKSGEVMFERGRYGKPFLKNYPDFKFNLSESGAWIVCAINNSEVGIDIQEVRPTNFGIAESFFAKEEYEDLMRKYEEERLDYFYSLWTLKESFIKAIGLGLYLPLNEFVIRIKDNGEIVLKCESEYGFYNFKQYAVDKGYKLAVCAADMIQEENLFFQSVDDILTNLN